MLPERGVTMNNEGADIFDLAKNSIQNKMRVLPSSQNMLVSDVWDILLDLQNELVALIDHREDVMV
jgi:hypothetical protein